MSNQSINGDKIIWHIKGHIKYNGCQANQEKNTIYVGISGKRYINCSQDKFIIIDENTHNRIDELEKMFDSKLTWFIMSNGYVATNIEGKTMYLHQLLMGYYGNGQGTKNGSVDHINRDKLDNRISNLRIVDFNTQHSNAKGIIPGTKRERKYNAHPLPPGITQNMLPKYVVYYPDEYMTKQGPKFREFFRIEKHPNQCGRELHSSKSNKVSITEKLEEAKRIVAELDKRKITDVNEVKPKKEVEENYTLPQYFHMTKQHGKDAVCFERRYNGKRVSLKVTIKKDETIQQAVERIIQQVDIETGEKKTTPKEVGGVTLSKGFSFSKSDGKDCISFQRNISGKRYVGKTIIGEGETIADTIERLKTNIKKRYELEDNILFSG